MSEYPEGSAPTLEVEFVDPANDDAPVDPTTVTIRWNEPSGQQQERIYGQGGSPEIVRIDTGKYKITVDTTNRVGPWSYTWFSTGVGQAAEKRYFDVTETDVT